MNTCSSGLEVCECRFTGWPGIIHRLRRIGSGGGGVVLDWWRRRRKGALSDL
jgi:hypothetical protein